MAQISDTYEISTDRLRVDIGWLHDRLSTDTYWAPGRPVQRVAQAVNNSDCYGVYRRQGGARVAFARLVTDRTVFAWLGDVYVDRDVRGTGISKFLVDRIMADVTELGLRRIMLGTADAHGLYRRFGFEDIEAGEWMQKLWPDNR